MSNFARYNPLPALRHLAMAASLSLTLAASSVMALERIVVADGALTEILYALGEESRIQGVDTTSTYPESASALPNVGYLRQLSAEGILSLQPDLLLTTQDAGPPAVLQQLRDAGVRVEQLQVDYSLQGTLALVRQVGQLIDQSEASEQLAQQIEQQVQAVAGQLADLPMLFVLNAGNRGLLASGTDTRAHALMQLVGGRNVFADFSGYKPMTNEAVLLAAPQVVLVSHADGDLSLLAQHPALSLTPAAQQGRLYSADHRDWLVFGPRLADAVAELTALIQADL